MREAIGGALLIKLVMVFIVIYVCFLAVAINYSLTFRVKNQIINLIESYEGYELAKSHIEDYVASIGYYKPFSNSFFNESRCSSEYYNDGYCIIPISSDRGNYYKVVTYVSFDFPIIGEIMNFPVSGETRIIYNQ